MNNMQTQVADAHQTLYSRPGMYLPSYEQKIDATSIISNFLDAVYGSQELTTPKSVFVTVSGTNFILEAEGCNLDYTPPAFDELLFKLSITSFREPFFDDGHVLGFVKSIVWFTQYCLVNISVKDWLFCQAFWRVNTFIEQPKQYMENTIDRFGFCFTLPPELFTDMGLEIRKLDTVLDLWEEQRNKRKTVEQNSFPKFSRYWNEQAQHHFSLRLQI